MRLITVGMGPRLTRFDSHSSMRRRRVPVTVGLLRHWVACLSIAWCAHANASAPPPGFEDLAGAQRATVDVRRGGDVVARVDADYTPDLIAFRDPRAVLDAADGLLDEPELLETLANPLPTNVDKVCVRPRVPEGCGRLTPEIAGVIFDEASFTVDLFVDPDFIELSIAEPEYLIRDASKPSGLASLGFAASRTGERTNATLSGSARAALGPVTLQGAGLVTSQRDIRLDEATAGYEARNWRVRGGAMDNDPLPVLGQERMIGARAETHQDARLDLERAFGSELVVIVPGRAQVEILRDGVLLSSQRIDGPTELDTGMMPDGAYEVTLRITEDDGTIREEARFFSKSRQLPAADEPRLVAEIGKLTERDELFTASGPVYTRVGMARRFTDTLGGGVDAVLQESTAFGVVSLFAFDSFSGVNTSFSANAVVSSDRDYGFEIGGQATIDRFRANLRYRIENVAGSEDDTRRFDRISRDIQQLSAGIGYGGTWGNVSASLSYFQQRNSSTLRFSPSVRIPLTRDPNMRLDLSARATLERDRASAVLRLSARHSPPGRRYSAGLTSGVDGRWRRGRDEEIGPDLTGSLDYRRLRALGGEARASVNARMRGNTYSGGSSLGYDNPFGRMSAFANVNHGGGTTRRTFGAQGLFNFAAHPEGVGIGGTGRAEAGVLIDVEGAPFGTRFDVLVGRARRDEVIAGIPKLVPLRPYEEYTVSLRAVDADQLVDLVDQQHEVTLFPGMVAHLSFDARPFVIVLGRIVGPDGESPGGGRIQGLKDPVVFGEDGWFQAEVRGEGEYEVQLREGEPCVVTLAPEPEPDQPIVRVGEVVCEPAGS